MNMSIEEYRRRLLAALAGFDREEVTAAADHFTELLEDAEDVQEEMERLGSPEQLAQRIISDNGWAAFDEKPAPEAAPAKGGLGWRITALFFTSPLWLTVYILIVSLMIVIVSAFIHFPFAALTSLTACFYWLPKMVSYSAAYLMAAIGLAGVTVLLFRPFLAGVRGTARLFMGFSRFLFGISRKKNDLKKPKLRPINKLVLIVSAAAAVIGCTVSVAMANHLRSKELTAKTEYRSQGTDHVDITLESGADLYIKTAPDSREVTLTAENYDPELLAFSAGDGSNSTVVKYASKSFQMYFMPAVLGKTKFTICLPSGFSGDLNIDNSYGDVSLETLTADELSVKCSCGDIILDGVKQTGTVFKIENDYGDIRLSVCAISEKAVSPAIIDRNGDIELNSLTAPSLTVNNSYGDTEGEKLTVGEIQCDSANGDIKLTRLEVSEKLVCDNNYGGIKMGLIGEDYNIKADTSYGETRVNGKKLSDNVLSGNVPVNVHCNNGDIDIETNTN